MPDPIGFLERCLAEVQTGAERTELGYRILKAGIESGFLNARLWSSAKDYQGGTDRLVLTGFIEPASDPPFKLGDDVDMQSAHVQRYPKDQTHPLPYWPHQHAYDETSSSADRKLAKRLGLDGQRVVEIPICHRNELTGILALGLQGDCTLADPDLSVLASIGQLIGQHLRLELYAAESSLVTQSSDRGSRIDDLLRRTLIEVTVELSAAVGAVFSWDPVENSLTKVVEYFNPVQKISATHELELAETYLPGQFLTGKAWASASERFVYSFEGIGKDRPEDIGLDSLKWHESLLGNVRSVLYGAMVPTHPRSANGGRYLLRLMNHAGSATIPFVTADMDALAKICGRASALLIDAQVGERLDAILNLATTAQADLGASVRTFEDAIRAEGIRDALVLAWAADEERSTLDFVHGVGRAGAGLRLSQSLRDSLPGDPLITKLDDSAEKWTGLGTSPLAATLRLAGFKAALGVTFKAGSIAGVVVIPSTSSVSSRIGGTRALDDQVARYLSSCAELLARSIELRRSDQMAKGALQALGYLGHELGTPMTQLGSLAAEATGSAQELAFTVLRQRAFVLRQAQAAGTKITIDSGLELADRLRTIERIGGELDQKSDFLASLLSLAPIFALRSNRRLRVNFDYIPIADILRDAVQRTIDDPMLDAGSLDAVVMHPWEIILENSGKSDDGLVCDRYFLTVALASLLRNAVKYSVPRPGSTQSRIELSVERQQQWTDFRVVNYGIGVAEDEARAIFLPFTQGTNFESRRAVRGMGLGLYLAQVIANSHKGRARLVKSEPHSLDDPIRIANLEGYRTVFELRVASRLAVGVEEIMVDDR